MIDLRPFTVAATLAAAGFALEGVISLVHPVGDDHWDGAAELLNGSFAVAVLALAVTLPYLGRWLRLSRSGRTAVLAGQIGATLMALESVVSGLHGRSVLAGLFIAGLGLMTLGLLVLGLTGLRTAQARWAGPLLFLAWLVSIAGGDHGGALLLAVVLLALTATLVRAPTPAGSHA